MTLQVSANIVIISHMKHTTQQEELPINMGYTSS
jgi:hypothetical protein